MSLPKPIKNLIFYFNKLPGIGTKTSEKFVFDLLKKDQKDIEGFARALLDLKKEIAVCNTCYNFSEFSSCEICSDERRNKKMICVVSRPQDIHSIETTRKFNGVYHVLGGTIDNFGGITPDKLNIVSLVERLKNNVVEELIFAFNPDMEGETTIMYLKKLLENFKDIKITRLGRGLPMGADIEYADEVTVSNAIEFRNKI